MSIVGNMPGESGKLLEMLQIISDKGLYESRIAQFEEVKRQANEAIALVGPAAEVMNLRDAAKADREAAAAELQRSAKERQDAAKEAQEAGARVLAAAQASANKAESDAGAAVAESARRAAGYDAAAKAAERALEEAKTKAGDIAAKEAALLEFDAALDAKSKVLDERIAKIAAAEAVLRDLVGL